MILNYQDSIEFNGRYFINPPIYLKEEYIIQSTKTSKYRSITNLLPKRG